jgi:hypothetical protein
MSVQAMGLLPAREDCSEPLRHKFHGESVTYLVWLKNPGDCT